MEDSCSIGFWNLRSAQALSQPPDSPDCTPSPHFSAQEMKVIPVQSVSNTPEMLLRTFEQLVCSAWLAADSEMKGWRFYLIWLLVNEDRSCLVTGRVSLVQPLYKQTLSSRRFPERAVQEHLSSQTYMPNTRRYTNICIWPQWLDVLQGSSVPGRGAPPLCSEGS